MAGYGQHKYRWWKNSTTKELRGYFFPGNNLFFKAVFQTMASLLEAGETQKVHDYASDVMHLCKSKALHKERERAKEYRYEAARRYRASLPKGQKSVGRKDDSGKPRLDLLPPKATLLIGEVLTHGANTYGDDNWRKVDKGFSRYMGAALRHLMKRLSGEKLDPDSGKPHLAHAATSIMFAMELDQ